MLDSAIAEFRTCESDLDCDPAAAKQVSDSRRERNEKLSMADIKAVVCVYFGALEDVLVSDKREPWMVMARYIAMFFCYRLTDKSSTVIGAAFRRDHSTVLYAKRKIAASKNATIKKYVDDLAAIFAGWPQTSYKLEWTCRKTNGHT